MVETIFIKAEIRIIYYYDFDPLKNVMFDSIFPSFDNNIIMVDMIFVIYRSTFKRDETGIVAYIDIIEIEDTFF